MNIKYLTDRDDKLGFPTVTKEETLTFLNDLDLIAIDSENSGLDAFTSVPLLISIGNNELQIVIDTTTIPVSFLTSIKNLDEKTFIGQNIKYDHKIFSVNGFHMKKVYCTQVVEETLRMGIRGGNSLEDIKLRRLGKAYEVSKDTRKEFIGQTKKMAFRPDHIKYAAEDVVDLITIKDKQEHFITKLKHKDWLYNVEFPLLLYLGYTELEGVTINKDKWKALITNNEKLKIELTGLMDNELIKLSEKYVKLRTPLYQRKRVTEEVIYLDLFGQHEVRKNTNKGNVNYSSNAQVKNIFRDCNASIPINDKSGKETTGKDAIANYILENPTTDLRNFCEKFIDYQQVVKRLSSFGEKYLDNINPITGKLHTIYRQCGTATGRFASGGGKFDTTKINSQQIPKDKQYRECFCEEDGYNILTIDLSGAELVILASLSGDDFLKDILDDAHSPLATASYNAIIKYILNVFPEHRQLEELTELLRSEERAIQAKENGYFTITSKDAKDLRNSFKAVIYGLSYGASADRVAFTLKVPMQYAEIIVDTLRATIPKVFKFLDESSKFGSQNGYILLSDRSNNRRWFKDIIDARKYGAIPEFKVVSSVERECKNAPIQGTQAAMIKEGAVNIYKYIENLDAQVLLLVHDELVIKFRKDQPYTDEFPEKIRKILCDTCNLYLKNGIEMEAEYEVLSTWTK